MPKPKPRVCGSLGQNEPYGVVDVCGEPHGHQTVGEGTPHKGVYHGMTWQDRPEYGHGKTRIIDPGDVMGAAQREELPHQRGKSRRTTQPQPEAGYKLGKRTKRPHAGDGWFPKREAEPFNPTLAAQRAADTRRRRGTT